MEHLIRTFGVASLILTCGGVVVFAYMAALAIIDHQPWKTIPTSCLAGGLVVLLAASLLAFHEGVEASTVGASTTVTLCQPPGLSRATTCYHPAPKVCLW